MQKAVFLDRDGVLIEDIGLFTDPRKMRLFSSVPKTLNKFKEAGFLIIVVTNQAIVARGMLTEKEVKAIHKYLAEMIIRQGGPEIDAFYFCPHHPDADLPAYRQNCECRKPNPGMLLQATEDYAIDLVKSFMIGDRISDVIAGKKAGCQSILIETGKHSDQPIVTNADVEWDTRPDLTCGSLKEASDWILNRN